MSFMNIEQARHNMVEQQIRPWDVLDQQVLDAIESTPRENFVPEPHRNLAFCDIQIPLENGRVMMEPKLEGRMVQTLDIKPGDSVLEVGAGAGYTAALMAKLGAQLTSIDIDPAMVALARKNLADNGIEGVRLEHGDICAGWNEGTRFDRVAMTAAIPARRSDLEEYIAVGGRMFVVVGEAPIMEALLITRAGERDFVAESLFDTCLPYLSHSELPESFEF